MAENTSKWGAAKAKARYAEGGEVLPKAREAAERKSWVSGRSAMDRAKVPFQLKRQFPGMYSKGDAVDFQHAVSAEEVSDAVPRRGEKRGGRI